MVRFLSSSLDAATTVSKNKTPTYRHATGQDLLLDRRANKVNHFPESIEPCIQYFIDQGTAFSIEERPSLSYPWSLTSDNFHS